MVVVKGFQALSGKLRHPVLTIGNFDGVHLGHQKIIGLAIEKARARGGAAVAYTFRPHPHVALRPGSTVQLLTTYDEKLELLERQGLDVTIEEPFSREFSTISPERFFSDVVLRRLGTEAIVVGYDFAFGKERSGHLGALEDFCKSTGVELTVVPPHRVEGEIVSSTRIRQHLLAGDVEAANRLLGRMFGYRGVVIKGDARGRKLGFPTANVQPGSKLALPYGVYATWAVSGEQCYPSVTNIGVRPTFQEGGRELPALVETHLLGTSLDLYGSALDVRFVRKLRDEKRFSGIEELKAQIGKDAEQARAVLAAARAP